MNDPLTTFLIVLLAAVGVISLRRVWRRLRDNEYESMNQRSVVRHMDKRITQLENERKD